RPDAACAPRRAPDWPTFDLPAWGRAPAEVRRASYRTERPAGERTCLNAAARKGEGWRGNFGLRQWTRNPTRASQTGRAALVPGRETARRRRGGAPRRSDD